MDRRRHDVGSDDDAFHQGLMQRRVGGAAAAGGAVLEYPAICRHQQGSGAAGGVDQAELGQGVNLIPGQAGPAFRGQGQAGEQG